MDHESELRARSGRVERGSSLRAVVGVALFVTRFFGAAEAPVSITAMGRSGQKSRKGKKKHSQHLAKVGTPAENERLQHAEREAVLENMGMGGAFGWLRVVIYIVIALVVGGAIYGLLLLTTPH